MLTCLISQCYYNINLQFRQNFSNLRLSHLILNDHTVLAITSDKNESSATT